MWGALAALAIVVVVVANATLATVNAANLLVSIAYLYAHRGKKE
jgi:hypothetical protein